jgi:hypothetical protein
MVTIVLKEPVKDYATRPGLEKQVKLEIKNSCKICGSTTTATCLNCNVRICTDHWNRHKTFYITRRTDQPLMGDVFAHCVVYRT